MKTAQNILLLLATEYPTALLENKARQYNLKMVHLATHPEAEQALEAGGVSIFMFSPHLVPRLYDFLYKLRQDHAETACYAVLTDQCQDEEVPLLQAGVKACLDHPLDPSQLSYHLGRLIAERSESYNPFLVHAEERTVVIPNDLSLVMQVVRSLVNTTIPLEDKRRYHVAIGLMEIINNAIEHGNLGITSAEKNAALRNATYLRLAVERARQTPWRDRRVAIRARALPAVRRVEYQVEDEGEGFDWTRLPDPTDGRNVLKRHGRGVLIARHAFHEVNYQGRGNQVMLVYNSGGGKP